MTSTERFQGPNVKKLVIQRMSQLMIPSGGGVADGISAIQAMGKGERNYAREAIRWVEQVIRLVRDAPNNPWGDDEAIAGEILRQVEERCSKHFAEANVWSSDHKRC